MQIKPSHSCHTGRLAERAQNERLCQIIKELQRHRFGRRAETLPEDQLLLGLEEVEQVAAAAEAEADAATPGATDLRFHDLRHEAISRFFEEKGLSIPEAALMSGHRDPRMLFRYTHLRPEALLDKLDCRTR